jgi:hypothetical protein
MKDHLIGDRSSTSRVTAGRCPKMRNALVLHGCCLAITVGCALISLTPAYANHSIISGVSVVGPPPADFDPLAASPEARAKYAFPPAPDAATAPEAYRRWERAVSAPRDTFAPVQKKMNIYHGPARGVRPVLDQNLTQHGIDTVTNNIWSGTMIFDSSNPFTTATVIGEFVVPRAHENPDTGYSGIASIWVGIDGWSFGNVGSGDVLQAGVDVSGDDSSGDAIYTAWVEWFPADPYYGVPLEIHPSDLISVQVWNTSPTKGYAFFYNQSTNKSATLAMNAPKNTTLVGSSVEWIVERPTSTTNNKPVLLNNYIDVAWPYGLAYKNLSNPGLSYFPLNYYLPGANPPTGTLYQLEMQDDKGKGISSTTIENSQFLYFTNYGSSSCKC